MADFKLVNENGTMLARDPATGNTIPLSMGDVDAQSLSTDELNNNLVYDTTGRYLGELTGTNDAQVVIDAIAGRRAGAGIIIPDPGFNLGWEQQVDLPAEGNFALKTAGNPTLKITSEFSGNCAFYLPSSASGLTIDRFSVDSWSNDQLDFALILTDPGTSQIVGPHAENCGGLQILSDQTYAAHNLIVHTTATFAPGSPNIQPCVDFQTVDGGANTVDQNLILFPDYADNSETGVAYRDTGKHNNWIKTRCEATHTVHLFDGEASADDVRNYYVSEGNWDRSHIFEYTVRETGNATGVIDNLWQTNFAKLRLLDPNTRVSHTATTYTGSGDSMAAADVLEGLRAVTPARSLASMGIRDNSNGGSVDIGYSFYNHPQLEWSTGATANQTAVADLGNRALKAEGGAPKAAYSWGPGSTGGSADGDDDVLVRHGIYDDDDDRAEFVYDPNNVMSSDGAIGSAGSGDHPNSNWYAEVRVGGTNQGNTPVDLGVAPSGDTQDFALNYLPGSDNSNNWHFAVDRINEAMITASDGYMTAEVTYRWSLETLADADKTWQIRGNRGVRLYRL